MNSLWETDWDKLFKLQMSLPEILIRGTVIYVGVCLMLRVVLKRQAGKVALSDLLIVSILAGICRNPLVRDAYSIPDGLLQMAVVLAWSYAMDWASFYSPLVHKLLHPKPVLLVEDGKIQMEHLRHELMTVSQLLCQLRQHGVKDPGEVQQAMLEGSGQVSVIKQQ